jgi:signal transduction histidine kinase
LARRDAGPATREDFLLLTLRRWTEGLLHEVRTPLNAIMINTELLNEKLKGDDGQVPESQAKHLKTLRTQVGRASELLGEFCQLLTRDTGPGDFDLGVAAHHALSMAVLEVRRRRIKVSLDIPTNTGVRVQCKWGALVATYAFLLYLVGQAELDTEIALQFLREGGRVGVGGAEVAPPSAGLEALVQVGSAELEYREGKLWLFLQCTQDGWAKGA